MAGAQFVDKTVDDAVEMLKSAVKQYLDETKKEENRK